MKLLLYCTKAKPYITRGTNGSVYPSCVISDGIQEWHLNGKIVAECDFEVEKINCSSVFNHCYATWNLGQEELLKFSCLERKQLVDYLGYENQIDGKWCGYAIHIKNLHIFDKPKELSEYYSDLQRWVEIPAPRIKKAPQNMMYAFDGNLQPYILISIKPEWLCKILNGEKTIEVRKKVLKEMLR